MFSKEIKESINESVLCWLATADDRGIPNCSPKEVFTYRGTNELLIADIASPKSVQNIISNPNVCISFVHIFKQKGFKLKGRATYITSSDNAYSDLFELIQPIANEFPVRGIIQVIVNSTSAIVAPSYYLIPGTTEESQIQSGKHTYGV